MLDQQINEQLGLLQKELSRLKTVTDYIDGAKENSISIIAELEKVQKNYAVYTDKIFNLYKQYVDDLKKNTEIQINEGVLQFETTGNKIDTTNKEKLVETKRLLEQYKKIVEATDSLVKTLEAVDFPTRLSTIDKNLQAVNSALNEAKQSIENKQSENQNILLQRLDTQDKEIKLLKTVLFIICGLIVIGTVATIFALK
jgi:phage gp29-like protein